MHATTKFAAVVIAALFAAPAAHSAADALSDGPETEVVVTATRRPQPKKTASAAVTVVTAEEIAASGAVTIAEVLSTAAGVDVPRYGPVGSLAPTSLRGSSMEQVLVLVDGRRVNNPQMGGADLSDIPLENVERIEVVRGGASALYGSDAVGGVINIITKSPRDGRATRFSGSYGSFDTQLVSGEYSESSGRVRYLLTGQRATALNDFRYRNPATGEQVRRDNSGYEGWDVTGKVIADLGDRRRLSFSGEYGDADKEVPGMLSWPSPDARQRDRRALFDLRYQMPLGAGDVTAALYRVQSRTHYTDPGTYPAPTDAIHRASTDVAELLGHGQPFAGHDVTYGYEFRNQRVRSSTIGTRSQTIHGVYVQDQVALGRLQLVPGVRADFTQGFEGEISPKLGLVARLSERLTARANVGRSFRAPNLNALYWPEDAFSLGNPGLRPERALMADAGASWRPISGLDVEVTGFMNRVTDLIDWRPDVVVAGKYSPVNVGKVRTVGVEANASWQATSRLALKANATHLNARDKSGAAATDGKKLPLRPEALASVGAMYRIGAAAAALSLRYTGRRPSNAGNTAYLPGVVVTDLRLDAPVGRGINASLQVNNLFDMRYQLQPDYPVPGRSITLRAMRSW